MPYIGGFVEAYLPSHAGQGRRDGRLQLDRVSGQRPDVLGGFEQVVDD
jgi:hypothetical protein